MITNFKIKNSACASFKRRKCDWESARSPLQLILHSCSELACSDLARHNAHKVTSAVFEYSLPTHRTVVMHDRADVFIDGAVDREHVGVVVTHGDLQHLAACVYDRQIACVAVHKDGFVDLEWQPREHLFLNFGGQRKFTDYAT